MNKDTSVGVVEDLLTNTMNLVALEYHLNILIRKYRDLNDLVLTPEGSEYIPEVEITELTMNLHEVTELRRKAMRLLKAQATSGGNKDYWCSLKHAFVSAITSFELWQTDLFNEELEQFFLTNYRLMNVALSKFLGHEPVACSACLADMMEVTNENKLVQ